MGPKDLVDEVIAWQSIHIEYVLTNAIQLYPSSCFITSTITFLRCPEHLMGKPNVLACHTPTSTTPLAGELTHGPKQMLKTFLAQWAAGCEAAVEPAGFPWWEPLDFFANFPWLSSLAPFVHPAFASPKSTILPGAPTTGPVV